MSQFRHQTPHEKFRQEWETTKATELDEDNQCHPCKTKILVDRDRDDGFGKLHVLVTSPYK